MDRGPEKDPGGVHDRGLSPGMQDSTELKEQFEQQQVVIAQLKETLRKTDTTLVTQEKVDRYAKTLSKMSARAKKSKLKKEGSASVEDTSAKPHNIDSVPRNEKISLLRKQMEENKVKLAERGKNKKEIEEIMTQLKAQFDDSQQMISETPLNYSLLENKTDYTRENTSDELYNVLLLKERRITDLSNKVHKLEANVLDLQENLKEKDSVIDARTKAITLMTESLNRKGKNTLDELEDTKEQMRKMQENFVQLESEMKARQIKLLEDLKFKNNEILDLQELNSTVSNELKEVTNQLASTMKSNDTTNVQSRVEIELQATIQRLHDKIHQLEMLNEELNTKSFMEQNLNSELKIGYEIKIEQLEVNLNDQIHKNEELLERISTKEDVIEKLKGEIAGWASADSDTTSKKEGAASELAELKNQLEKSNTRTIKMKLDHKNKVKELNKKIEMFKKRNDAETHIVKLEEANAEYQQKIAELEEEKGHLQLKMMESPTKESDETLDLETRIADLTNQLQEKEFVINHLETEIVSAKSQIESLNQKMNSLSHLQNEQVSSEITSIRFEELLDVEVQAKNEAISTKEAILKERDDLLEKIEFLTKEKLDTQNKLDHYMQENMELMDKMEKLSAEKVSSAESIEIVENLTQQEKLELEHYQKNLDIVSGKLKSSEEHLEHGAELNESVNVLNEETSELLQKIELFTVERREVMEKMEILSNENSQLNLKIKEVENNRDILTETYEQLQNEKELLDERIEKLENENGELKKNDQIDIPSISNQNQEEIKLLQNEIDNLIEEKNSLKRAFKEISERVHEKDSLESELKQGRSKISELESVIENNSEEIRNFQMVLEDNKNELINSATHINKLQEQLEQNKNEINLLNSMVDDLNTALLNLENQNKFHIQSTQNMEVMGQELQELKTTLNENINQMEDYENELEQNSIVITNLNKELKELNNRILETENLLDNKDKQLREILEELENRNNMIGNLQEVIKSKDEMFHKISRDLKDKCLALQKQTDTNTGSLDDIKFPLQKKIDELTRKNTQQLEKMKKIAANLKKKTLDCKELEDRLKANEAKWEIERSEKELQIKTVADKVDELRLETEKSKETILQLRHELEENTCSIVKMVKSQGNISKSEVSLQEELSDSISHETLVTKSETDTSFYKIQELEMIIETQESDLQNYRDRVSVLEETLSNIEERRVTLERKTDELGAQLEEKSHSFEEISQTEDLLEKKLSILTMHNEEIEKRLQKILSENKELTNENKRVNDVNDKLQQKVNIAQDKVNELISVESVLEGLEQEITTLKKNILNSEYEMKQLENEKDRILQNSRLDLEKLDSDWQSQFNEIMQERNVLNIACEKLQEKLNELTESQSMLLEEIEQYKLKLEQNLQIQQELERDLANQSEISAKEVSNLQLVIQTKIEEIEKLQALEQPKQETKQVSDYFTFDGSVPDIAVGGAPNSNAIDHELNETKEHLIQAQKEVADLQAIIKKLRDEEKVVNINQQPPSNVVTFHFPEELDDPFDFVKVTSADVEKSTSIPNTKDELLKKIKTLEFMLNHVETERDDVLSQCSTLTNELMRLIYERQTGEEPVELLTGVLAEAPKSEFKISNQAHENWDHESDMLEPHIFDAVDTPETGKELRNLEFEKTKEHFESDSAVVEDICVRKEAYICHPVVDATTNLTQQILHPNVLVDTSDDKKELQNLEFEKTKEYVEHTEPIEEDRHEEKSAYLCHGPGNRVSNLEEQIIFENDSLLPKRELLNLGDVDHIEPVKLDTFGEDDDGWGWNPEETKLEEEHRHQTEANLQVSSLNSQIEGMRDHIRVLELEREHHNRDFKEMQVKSGKLIKKLKELKIKNDELQRGKKQNVDEFRDLENAIQEELKSQITDLEKRVKDVSTELVKEKAEKTSLQKRVDVLASANDRMIDMKEKQDIQMLSWQRKTEDLSSKLNQYEWGDDGFGVTQPKSTVKLADKDKSTESDINILQATIAELNENIKELSLDNEELQTLLEEQRALRLNAEKLKSMEPIDPNFKSEAEYLKIVREKQSVEENLATITDDKKKVENELNNLIKKNEEQSEAFSKINEEKLRLDDLLSEKEQLLENLNRTIQNLEAENSRIQEVTAANIELNAYLQDLVLKLDDLEQQNIQLQYSLEAAKTEFANENDSVQYRLEIENIILEKDLLASDLQEKTSNIQRLVDEKEAVVAELKEKNEFIEHTLNEKETLLGELKQTNIEIESLKTSMQDQITLLNGEIENLTKSGQLQSEQHSDLITTLSEKEIELQRLVDELNSKNTELEQLTQDWQLRVDQRGVDIAESWKLHLDSRESEFSQLEVELRKEINELEEKCNVLVNENNELRKNVDAEIRNEVDRISALQQQINDRQQYINELTHTLNNKQLEIETIQLEIPQYEVKLQEVQAEVDKKDNSLRELSFVLETTQKQLDDNREIINILTKKLEESSETPLVIDGKLLLDELERQLNSVVQTKELALLNEEINQKQAEDIQGKLKDIQEKLAGCYSTIEENQARIDSLNETLDEKNVAIQEKEEIITNFRYQLQQTQSLKQNESENVQNLHQSLYQCQQQYAEVSSQLLEKSSALEALNNELLSLQQTHETEFRNIQSYLEDKEKEHDCKDTKTMEEHAKIVNGHKQEIDSLRIKIDSTEQNSQELLSTKDLTINTLHLQLQEQSSNIIQLGQQLEEFNNANLELSRKLQDYEELQNKLFEQNVLLEEEDKQIGQLRVIIENQVLKIEELKGELYEKSNEYDSLIAEMDMRNETKSSEAKSINTPNTSSLNEDDDLTEQVCRAELDLALYMLHQRDVRCEELTVELTHLLEERDTLQLRLSNALREKEEEKMRKAFSEHSFSDDTLLKGESPSKGAIPKGIVSDIVLKSSGTELAVEAQEKTSDELANKLSELRSIGYKKDKTIVDEQDLRRLQQFSIMQQHRDAASRLPPEAAARLVDASYTLSRDVQSPSKVLLNWLWGKSTPKVNDL